ncbi:MAG: hypothetical protein Q8R28_15135 [Dehalococcoidia bacterium]|nr:hypothetical protein [Dehalococcoidia bacterium]
MEKTEGGGGSSSSGDKATNFVIQGELRDRLLRLAVVDGLDVGSTAKEGRAINAYVRAAVDDLLRDREASKDGADGNEEADKGETGAEAAEAEAPV